MGISVDIREVVAMSNALLKAEQVRRRATRVALGRAAHAACGPVEAAFRKHTPWRTGNLAQSTKALVTSVTSSEATITVVQPAENIRGDHYAAWVLGGHRIVAKGGRDTGFVVPPNDYASPAIEEVRPVLRGLLAQAGREINAAVTKSLQQAEQSAQQQSQHNSSRNPQDEEENPGEEDLQSAESELGGVTEAGAGEAEVAGEEAIAEGAELAVTAVEDIVEAV